MFYRYEIKKNGSEEVLYLFLTMKYEFSKELVSASDDNELKRRTSNFIKNNNIRFNGNKVYLVVDGFIVKAFDLGKKNIELLEDNLYYSNDNYLVTLELEDNSIVQISLREYLMGAVATNMIDGLDVEVLKCLAVLFRTYVFNEMSENKKVKAINNMVLYRPISYYKISFTSTYNEIINTINEAVDDTDCIFLSYKGKYILPFFHITNNGVTLSDTRYPYLSSVVSLWDYMSPFFIDVKRINYNTLSQLLNKKVDKNVKINIKEMSPSGKVLRIEVNGLEFDGLKFSKLLNLKSLYLSIIINKEDIVFISRGYGEFLGLSLFGANELAKNGCYYTNILDYYFPICKINKYIKELS